MHILNVEVRVFFPNLNAVSDQFNLHRKKERDSDKKETHTNKRQRWVFLMSKAKSYSLLISLQQAFSS